MRTGYLVTSWLSPGRHEFTVQATSQGRIGQSRRSPWSRGAGGTLLPPGSQEPGSGRCPTAVPPDRGALYTETAPSGRYTMVVDRRFVQHRRPHRAPGLKSDYAANAKTLTVSAPVWTFSPETEGGWCDPWGPEAAYTWSVSGNTLTLAPTGGADACSKRGAIFTGEWTRVG